MNTTMLFAELIIIGLEGGIWLLFLILTLFGRQHTISALSPLKDWQVLLVAVLFPLMYAFGIILDRIADRLFHSWSARIRRSAVDWSVHPTTMRFALTQENEFLNQQIEYTRSRMRIARSSSINFALIALFTSTFLLTQPAVLPPQGQWLAVLFVVVFGAIMVVGAIYSWQSLIVSQAKLVKTNYDLFLVKAAKDTEVTVTDTNDGGKRRD